MTGHKPSEILEMIPHDPGDWGGGGILDPKFWIERSSMAVDTIGNYSK